LNLLPFPRSLKRERGFYGPQVGSVTVTSTNGGAFTGSGVMEINWPGADSDPHAQLTYAIEYSADGGLTWETLAVDWRGQSYSLDSGVLQASSQGLVRVIASDGLYSSSPAASGSISVLTHAPSILLNAPMSGAIFIADEQIVCDATVFDLQDGPLDGVSVVWRSSLNGVLGSGDVLNLEADSLSEGSHAITVTATDSLGLSNSASIQIFVLQQPTPKLSLRLSAWRCC
jgi:hypothetical protein